MTAQPIVTPDEARHLLVIDDDSRIRTLLQRFLGSEGFRVTTADSAADARRRMAAIAFDLIILDVMMPGEDGMSFARSLRGTGVSTPILMLTALADTKDRIRGLEQGVDDYVSKPFEPRELVLRINAILKRGLAAAPAAPASVVRFGPFEWRADRSELTRDGEPVRLTERELQLMTMFAARPGETVSRLDIVGTDVDFGDRTADVQVNRLRRKIEPDPANPRYLHTVRGIGYRLRAD